MNSLSAESIRSALAIANQAAIEGTIELTSPQRTHWQNIFLELCQDGVPRTYLAVLGVVLTARTQAEKEFLNVLHIKAGSSPHGYAAPSIGKELASFIKAQGIDLRANSQQPMNNQPFTYKEYIAENMGVRAANSPSWSNFYKAAVQVNELDSRTASEVLALLFDFRRVQQKPPVVANADKVDLSEIDEYFKAVSKFVGSVSDNGKVGQAFVSAILGMVYGKDSVLQGDSQDPDVGLVGDVHVFDANEPSIYVEVKQTPITTGPVIGFLEKAHAHGATRAMYFAMQNEKYSGYVSLEQIAAKARKLNMTFVIYSSPEETIQRLFPLMRGAVSNLTEDFSAALRTRLDEAGVSITTMKQFQQAGARGVTFL